MPEGITGNALKQWRLARGWNTRQMAEALRDASEKPLATSIPELAKTITKWEAGCRAPREDYLLLYHRVFPGLGEIPPPAGLAVFGGPGQPSEARDLLARAAGDVPSPVEVAAMAVQAVAAGADQARIWALLEKYRDLYQMAGDTAAILGTLTGEGGEDAAEQAG